METLSLTPVGEEQLPNLAAIMTQGSLYKLRHNDEVWDDGWTEDEVRADLETSTPYLVTVEGAEVV